MPPAPPAPPARPARPAPPDADADRDGPAEGSHLVRSLRLLAMLQAGPARTTAELAPLLGVDPRTVRRHLDKLREAGIPLEKERGHRHRLARGFFVQPPDLTLEEVGALTLAGEAAALPAPLAAPLREAARKLRAALPPALCEGDGPDRARARARTGGVSVAASPGEDGAADDVYARLDRALRAGVAVDCVYAAPDREPEAFRLDPWELHFSRRAWYVTGLHHGRGEAGEPRNLRLSRFERVEPTELPCAPPAGFSMARHLGAAWRMIRGGELHDVRVRFRRDFAETVEATLWHASQSSDWGRGDGTVDLCFRVDGLDEICWWVLGYGPGAEVIQPPALRERVANLAAETAAVYGGDARPPSMDYTTDTRSGDEGGASGERHT